MTTPPEWRKSSRSTGGTSEQCVELAQLPTGIGFRDSKAPHTPHLTLTPDAFTTLLTQAKHGKLDP
ncbi:uncharacterized protein DUF397 [Actinomadura pelletieri DSM 43383]|uniref:Uncharacterized protein DUF397 n=1 Tax=Actinomadura pelletieri DSM 43383 TaxID=1120940 RepID=A0A495R078_9ACTN|nr:DUF397 domain-containing protein [Actinomadura pelletieri]RKS79820.1 uncharacterized protein DUF397 [Actinomadura pelletieri DSM 43383]